MSFAPPAASSFSGALRLEHGAEALELALTGKGQNQMTITVVGSGQVTSSPAGLTCTGETCVGLFDPVVVTFTARTENASGRYMAGWTGGNCRARRDCAFTMTRSGVATARFEPLTNNLAFTSSATFTHSEGGLAIYDEACNRRACGSAWARRGHG